MLYFTWKIAVLCRKLGCIYGGLPYGLQKHNQRENKNHSNIDIDKARTSLNCDLLNKDDINYLKNIKTIIKANKVFL